ncbi:hypothetical protein LZC95_00365 [Pendulispora brunnea]|uniref:NTP pyrophosphohydrolase MazG-like domain-containing protein n=1 Tax=Pendulispora brunnea TaxID=2905690 RepID=A0ABZ2K9C9_9BACT
MKRENVGVVTPSESNQPILASRCRPCPRLNDVSDWHERGGETMIHCPPMPTLKDRPTLADYQAYVTLLEQERGFANQSAVEKCLLLGEEIGELFKAVRNATNMGVDETATTTPIGEELADVLIYLCSIANRFEVDLEAAFRAKEVKNHMRTWK